MLRRERGWLAVLVGMGLINAGVVLTEWQPANAWLLTPAFVLIATGVWGLACAALGLLPGGGGAGRGEPPEPCAPGETAKLAGVSKPANGEAREEGARPAGGGSGFSVCPLGRNALPTMLALCLFARFGVPAVAWLAGKSGIPRLDFQTIVAISGLFVLEWWRRWLSRRNWQVSL
jgi:hypothetical protein